MVMVLSGSLHAAALPPTSTTTGYSDYDVIALVAYILLALIFSFSCSIAEAVLLSITPSFIAQKQKEKPKLGALLKKIKQDKIDQSLAAILTLNTIAHTVGAIGSGSKATVVFGSAWFGLFSAVMTLLILFLSEIIPKTLGARYWHQLSGPTAKYVQFLIFSLYPLIRISESLTRLLSGKGNRHPFSRDELIAMAGIGVQSGDIEPSESRILQNLFRLRSLSADKIMTPRPVVFRLNRELTITEALDSNPEVSYSRIPVFHDNVDHITGFVLRSEMLDYQATNRGNTPLHRIERNLQVIPESKSLVPLLELFLQQRLHIALVVDEYGGVSGIVTLEDIVETLLGAEIVDEQDTIEDLQKHALELKDQRLKKTNAKANKPSS